MTGPQDPYDPQDPNYPAYRPSEPPAPGFGPTEPPAPGFGWSEPPAPGFGPSEPPSEYGYGAPPPGYGPLPGYQAVPAAGAPVRTRRRLPARVHARPDPKFGVSLAGIGVALVTVGVIIWGGDYLGHGIGGGSGGVSDSHRLLGVALSLIAILAGYTLTITQRTGPLTTAGVVASALGVPVLMGFLTFTTDSGGPFQIDAVFLVSIGAWVVSYFWVRGARGHSFYLGLAAVALWIYVLDKAESFVFLVAGFVERALPFGQSSSGPDWNTIGGLSLTFGVGYYIVMAALDRSGRRGAGTPFAVSGFVATVAGILALSPHTHTKGTAVMFIGFGLGLAWVGAQSARRFTTWVWTFAMGGGVVALIGDSLQNNNAGAGILLIVIGAALVGIAAVYTRLAGEPLDDAPEPVGLPH